MSKIGHLEDTARSLEAALRFAEASGAWLVGGAVPDPGTAVDTAEPSSPRERVLGRSSRAELTAVREDLGDCRRCRLSESRTHIVFGVGDPAADLLFVGEAPGEEEDRRGEPFVGRAGQLLDLMIRAIGLERGAVYIANVLKCRPPRNREPASDEVASCLPFLWRQIEAIRPRVICALGSHSARNLLGETAAIGTLRGKPQTVRGWTVLPTYHPAYLLRNPLAKRAAWQDLRTVRGLLER